MSEVTDVILPVLQKIQADLANFRRETKAELVEVKEMLLEQGDKVDVLNSYVTVSLGHVSRHEIDIDEIRKRLTAVEAKLPPPPEAV
ncbi:hypothetical protein ABB55_03135 [Prosthecomicrobium hirschii]|uniref:Uncharacterized protein n=1 Tax=Prosthecodimorpha hirschii TaxID=665126 RepID=A0A0P6WA55_9HYPH|nr:hypothetical protein [Prosthecomicrobium hirschii]KPL51343.1 hypothetical protein ABB55_03135 [Prosthecomicrobium hirschii]